MNVRRNRSIAAGVFLLIAALMLAPPMFFKHFSSTPHVYNFIEHRWEHASTNTAPRSDDTPSAPERCSVFELFAVFFSVLLGFVLILLHNLPLQTRASQALVQIVKPTYALLLYAPKLSPPDLPR